jgi:hypothetical protein
MKIVKYRIRIFQFLIAKLLGNSKPIKELIHPRIEITKKETWAQKKDINAILF